MVSNLGHVGLVCDNFFKMRDFYTVEYREVV